MVFYEEMVALEGRLESLGHEVRLPPHEVKGKDGEPISVKEYYRIRKEVPSEPWVWERKKEAILDHFQKVEWGDAVLVLNKKKNGVSGYIGANTLLEMGLALFLGKRIFLQNPVPELPYTEEILGMNPEVINSNLENLK